MGFLAITEIGVGHVYWSLEFAQSAKAQMNVMIGRSLKNLAKAVITVVVFSSLTLREDSLSITTTSSSLLSSGNLTGVTDILNQIATEGYALGDTLYKKEYDGGAEYGGFKNKFNTTFVADAVSGENQDASGGSITWNGPSYITNAEYLLVKDGNSKPAWYLFDISDWDGKETIALSDFWPGKGAISHVAIYGGSSSTTTVPDGGATAI